MPRGVFIVFEGLDRSGKTTQTEKLTDYLNSIGKKTILQRFPDRAEPVTGPAINNYLLNAKSIGEQKEGMHLLFAANRWFLAEGIEAALAAGTNVVADRYSFSGVSYSLSKGVPQAFAASPEIGLLRPDIVLFFDVDAATVAQRGGFGDEVMEKAEFQALVKQNMSQFADKDFWTPIDANKTIDEVHENVKIIAEKAIATASELPLRRFEPTDLNL
uniref:dTMP kinase n=1 Tax=Panagrellus redivivus TaxID=6233 RepID=A0A7E4W4N0_PANRE